MTTLTVLTILRLVHLTGLIMGFGGAVLADYTIFSHGVIRPVGDYTIFQTRLLSHIVSIGLCILWVSGFALIMVKLQLQPDFMQNPKVWAKIVVVVMLTINGILVHRYILPLVTRSQGRRLFDGVTVRQIAGLTFLGSVSLVSWSLPFVLGKAAGLNFITPMSSILATYLALVLVAWLGLFTFMSCVRSIQQLAAKQSAELDMTAKSWDEQIAALREGAVIDTRHRDDRVRDLAHFRN
jgi:hypothetical protein